jgi:hypothetical protein
MGLPNGSSAETIFEKIDSLFGAAFFRPWIPGTTNTLELELDGPGLPVVLNGNVKISGASGNTISANSDGLFVSAFNNDYKVKVDVTAPPRYLEDAMIGGTDGCVSISVIDRSGILNIQPLLDLDCFVERLCDSTGSTKADLGLCVLNAALLFEDSDSIDFDVNQVGEQMQIIANTNISGASGNTLSINPDGLYTAGGTFTINNNAPTRLITANGTSTSADAQSTLLYDSTIGTLTATPINHTLVASTSFYRGMFNTNLLLNQTNYGVKVGNLTSVFGGLIYSSTGNTTFGRGYYISSMIAESALNTSDSSTSSGLIASIVAKIDAFGDGTYSDVANIRTNFPATDAVESGVFSGTITNYYALFIGEQNGDEGGINPSLITNKYAIFQEGSTLLNSFATAVVVTSDERVKTNIEDYTKGLSEIETIVTVKYNFKETPNDEKKVGVLAQNVESVIPEAIHTSNSKYYGIEDFKRLDNDVLVYTLINAVKELSSQNKSLNERIFALESKNIKFGS